jgi:hypothetical protein
LQILGEISKNGHLHHEQFLALTMACSLPSAHKHAYSHSPRKSSEDDEAKRRVF